MVLGRTGWPITGLQPDSGSPAAGIHAHVPEHPAVRRALGAGQREGGLHHVRARARRWRRPSSAPPAHRRRGSADRRPRRRSAWPSAIFGLDRAGRTSGDESPTAISARWRSPARWRPSRSVLLRLDEPAAGMNPQEKAAARGRSAGMPRERRASPILLIEHDMGVVMDVLRPDHRARLRREASPRTHADTRSSATVIEAYLGDRAGRRCVKQPRAGTG